MHPYANIRKYDHIEFAIIGQTGKSLFDIDGKNLQRLNNNENNNGHKCDELRNELNNLKKQFSRN